MRMSETTHSGAVQNIIAPVSKASAPHYTWASICDGWRLIDAPGLSVVEERVPPGAEEVRHYHKSSAPVLLCAFRQCHSRTERIEHRIRAGSGIQVLPGIRHKFMNKSDQDVVFLVISAPSTKADRIDVK
jgi:quercetin dioxygenase-like cupin family protein